MNFNLFLVFLIYGLLGWFSTTGIKSQLIRLYDVFVIGPILIYIGFMQTNKLHAHYLYFFGITTMTYNFKNYLTYKRNMQTLKKLRAER